MTRLWAVGGGNAAASVGGKHLHGAYGHSEKKCFKQKTKMKNTDGGILGGGTLSVVACFYMFCIY